jgi:hypothetical protein
MLGFIDGKKHEIPRDDRLILLDQTLIDLNQSPISQEEKLEFLKELAEEIDTTFMIAGINRKKTRDLLYKRT